MIWLDALAAAVTGVLSGWGIGGGSILMVYLGAFRGIGQQTIQGINLAYFIPVSAGSLVTHIRNRLVDLNVTLITAASGSVSAVVAALFANRLDVQPMRRLFGVFLIVIGIREIFHKKKEEKN